MNYLTGFLIGVLSFGYTQVQAPKKIDKESCTITLENGKTFKLYGRVQVVESLEDIKVQIVESLEEVDIQVVPSLEQSCGKWKFVESLPDVRIKFVSSLPDVKVKYVESLSGIR